MSSWAAGRRVCVPVAGWARAQTRAMSPAAFIDAQAAVC